MSLVNELGASYVNEWFCGALIHRKEDGLVHMISRVGNNNTIRTHTLSPTSPRWQDGTLDASVLKSFSDLSYPRLGYRNFTATANGREVNTVRYTQAERSVHRGLRRDNLGWEDYPAAVGLPLGFGMYWDIKEVKAIFWPTWIKYTDGIKGILSGDILSFAVNEDLAVGISTTSGDAQADIYFRRKLVGRVEKDGRIVLFNKMLRRNHFKSLMEGAHADL